MRLATIAGLGLACLLGATLPAHAGGPHAQPAQLSYTFARGGVTHNRQLTLTLVIQSEDPTAGHWFNNGTYKMGFTARMVEYVVQASTYRQGDARVQAVLDTVSANINGAPVPHVIPDPYNPATHQIGSYILYIFPDGTCDCSALPDMIYAAPNSPDKSTYYLQAQPMGELFTLLHPSLPRTATLPASWTTTLGFPYGGDPLQRLSLTSTLRHSKSGDTVVSHLSQTLQAQEPAARWAAERDQSQLMAVHHSGSADSQIRVFSLPIPYAAWPEGSSGLFSGDPVVMTGRISVDSTLQIPQSDGVNVNPSGGKAGTPGSKGTAGTLCIRCNGYSMPLDGTEHYEVTFSQDGNELQKVSMTAHLTVTIMA